MIARVHVGLGGTGDSKISGQEFRGLRGSGFRGFRGFGLGV